MLEALGSLGIRMRIQKGDVALLQSFTLANGFFGDFWPEFVDQGRVQGIAVDNCGELVNVLVLHVQAAVFAKVGVPLALHRDWVGEISSEKN